MHTGEDGWCTYEGSWMKGLKHGQGSLTYGKKGEEVYYGGWENDRKHGEGKLVYASGSTYNGGWSEGRRKGSGRAVLVIVAIPKDPDASLMHKHWRLDATAIQIYDGEWSNDLPNGSGTDISADDGVERNVNILRNTYIGSFSEGKRSGEGTFYYSSGAIFKGMWKDDLKQGPGYLIYEDGTIYSGKFTHGRYLASKDDSVFAKEPLELLVEGESNAARIKRRLSDLFLRNNTKLREIFSMYSYFPQKPSEETNIRYVGRARALTLEQVWQLCHDAKLVEPEIGLAKINLALRGTPGCWDYLSEVHSPTRQFIYREFLESIVKLTRLKNQSDSLLDSKVDEFLQSYILNIDACGKESPYTLAASEPVQKVFEAFKPQMQQFFNETLREVGTSDATIKILYLNLFFLRFGPDLVAEQSKLIAKLIDGLYYKSLNAEEDNSAFLDCNINYRECELCLLLIAMGDPAMPGKEPKEMLEKVLKEVVVPNLATTLEVLVNEPPPPPAKKGGKKK